VQANEFTGCAKKVQQNAAVSVEKPQKPAQLHPLPVAPEPSWERVEKHGEFRMPVSAR